MINPKISIEKHWFALYTKPRHEYKAEEEIRNHSIEVYLPTIIVEKRWSDRKKKVEEPLFKNYLFVRADECERINCLKIPSVIKTVCFNGRPSIIPDWQIENLKKILIEKPDLFVTNRIEIGQKVQIIEGPFQDVVGIVTEHKEGEKHLAVSIDLLKRSVLVRLTDDSIIKILEN
jgi:transcription elongation factor/antiterminator RfaH